LLILSIFSIAVKQSPALKASLASDNKSLDLITSSKDHWSFPSLVKYLPKFNNLSF